MAVDYAALAKQYGGTTAPASPTPSSSGHVDYSALAAQYGGKTQPAPIAPTPASPSFGERIAADFAKRNQTVADARTAVAKGEESVPGAIFDTGGQVIGTGVDVAKEALMSLPGAQPVANTIGKFLGATVGRGINAVADKISNIPALQRFAQTPASKTLQRHVESGQEYLNLIPTEAGAGVAADAVKAAAEKGAQAAATVAKPVIAPFAKSYLPEVDQAFRAEGITPPVSAITKSQFLQGAESLASKSPFGRPIIDQVKNAEKAIEDKTSDIVKRITPMKTVSDENLGKTIQEGLKEYEQHFKQTEEKVYNTFAAKYGKSDGIPVTTRGVLGRIVTAQGKDFFKGVEPRFANMLDTLSGETPEIGQMRAQGVPESVIEQQKTYPKMSFDQLKETRTSVGEQLARDPENGALKQLYGALSADMQRAVETVDGANGGKALQKLNAQYKAGKDKIESRIASSIEQSNPERIAQNLVTRNSADTLKVLQEMIGPLRFAEVSKAFLRHQFENATTRGKFDVAKLKKSLAGYDKDTINEVLSPDQRADLQDAINGLDRLQGLTDALKPGKKFTEGSQTAYLQNTIGLSARVSGVVGALASGNVALASALLFGVGGEAGLAKLFATDAGRKYLTKGIGQTAEKKTIGDYLRPNSGNRSTTSIKPYSATPSTKPTKKFIAPTLPRKPGPSDWTHRLNGAEDKIRGYDDGEWPEPRR